jgi:hypothetical protein
MTDDDIRCESTFEVEMSPADAWRALEEIRIKRIDPDKRDEWWFPGFESRAVEVDRDEPRRLTVRKAEQPCLDSIIEITFEHTGTGSTIRVTQSGFDQAFVDMAGEAFWIHAEHIFADLHLFFATGVVADRAWLRWTPLGMAVTSLPLGVRVDGVSRDAWAGRVGLHDGDLLCTVHDAPIFSARDLGLVERIVSSGDVVRATWVRDCALMEGSATV